MAEYLIKKGIPENHILIDNLGVTTKATAENARKLNLKGKSITIISNY